MPAAYVRAAGHPPSRRAGEWFADPAASEYVAVTSASQLPGAGPKPIV
jgi:hypothetical protein